MYVLSVCFDHILLLVTIGNTLACRYYLPGNSVCMTLELPLLQLYYLYVFQSFVSLAGQIANMSLPASNSFFPGIKPCLINSALFVIYGSIPILATAATVSPFA